jgi:hypothetical protein
MEKYFMALISLAFFIFFGFAAARAWRKRSRAQAIAIDEPLEALDFFGEVLEQSPAFYVATTYAENHLERISAYGLGARGNGQVLLFDEGVLIVRTGERPLAIEKASLLGASSTQVAIDKAVEPKGILAVQWMLGEVELATHLRIIDPKLRQKIQDGISNLSVQKQLGK